VNGPVDVVSPVEWHTRIGSFRFPQCVSATTPPVLVSAASRKVHSTAGTFDIDLPLTGNPGIECRTGGANGDHTVVFTFQNPVTSCGTASTGTVHPGTDAHQCVVDLTGLPNAQYTTINLLNVQDQSNNIGPVSVTMGVLLGDTTANTAVNASDIAQAQSQSGQAVTSANFREDVTVNGAINSSDIATVQQQSGTALP
jgi:hypothetical protein